jgi:hypothetical protein
MMVSTREAGHMRKEQEETYSVHGQVMAYAVLPSLGLFVGGLVGVFLEPVVDIA